MERREAQAGTSMRAQINELIHFPTILRQPPQGVMAPRFGQVRAQRLMAWVLAAMAVLLLSPGAHALRPLPSATSARASVAATPWAPTGELRTALEARLEAIVEWTMTLNLRSDNVTGTEVRRVPACGWRLVPF